MYLQNFENSNLQLFKVI